MNSPQRFQEESDINVQTIIGKIDHMYISFVCLLCRLLILRQYIVDPNYTITYRKGKKTLIFRAGLKCKTSEKRMRRRFAMLICEDPSNVFQDLPCRHPLWDTTLDDIEPVSHIKTKSNSKSNSKSKCKTKKRHRRRLSNPSAMKMSDTLWSMRKKQKNVCTCVSCNDASISLIFITSRIHQW